MNTSSSAAENRSQLLARLFPEGVPKLWCPALTHYERDGRIDPQRIAAHLRHMSANVKGFLILGSTGDGWELSKSEKKQLLAIALHQAQSLKFHLLIGELEPAKDEALRMIWDRINWLKTYDPFEDRFEGAMIDSLTKARVCGFAVCPPSGNDVSQPEMERHFELVLESGIPTALYQLPQVTKNEISPELASSLAARFNNFIMFKDSSGADRVVSSGNELGGVFMVRGAEGNYARWLKMAGGSYDGFLLSTANCFAKELHQMIIDLLEGRAKAANEMSERLTATVSAVFELVSPFPDGNAF